MTLAAVPALALAQSHPAHQGGGVARTIGSSADSVKVYESLHKNAPQEFVFSGVPKFAVVGKDRSFYLGIGGYLKVTAGYDAGNVIDNANEFVTAEIPMSVPKGDKGKFNISGMQSQLFVNFVGLPNTDNEFGAFFSMNFLNDYSPVLQFAYMKYRGVTAGYDYTLFSDPASMPPTIDYEGAPSSTAIPTGVVNYTRDFGKKKDWKFGVGVELPMVTVTPSGGTRAVNQRVPTVPAFIQYSWAGGNSWLRLSAVMRNMLYHDVASAKNVDKVGWGLQLSGSAKIFGPLTAYYQAVYGKGISSFIQDLNGGGMDMAPDPGNASVLNTVKAWGGYGGLQLDFSKNVFMTASYSHVRTYLPSYSGGATSWGEQYKYAQYVVTNVFWNVNALFQTGVEYIYGRRVDYSGAQGHDNRIQAMVQLNF